MLEVNKRTETAWFDVQRNDYPGTFIVVEGADGAGTTTMSEKIADELDCFYTFEPTDNPVGAKVDEMISGEEHSAETIALGFASDRMIHLEEEIIPRLKKGETVVCDRYYHSSLVYQSVMGLDFEWIRELNRRALRPDLTIILDVSAETGMGRVESRGPDGNIFEDLSFQEKVVVRYRQLGERLDENVKQIDGSESVDEVFEKAMLQIDNLDID